MKLDDIHKRFITMFHESQERLMKQSWFAQDKIERKARLQAVMELSAELVKIKAVSIFSTGFGESVIEDIIQGDWDRAHECAQHCRFKEEGEEIQTRYAPLWDRFVALTEAVCAEAKARQRGNSSGPS